MGIAKEPSRYSKLSADKKRKVDELTEARFKATAGEYLADIYEHSRKKGLGYSRMPPPVPAMYRQARNDVLTLF